MTITGTHTGDFVVTDVREIAICDINPDPTNPRAKLDGLADLVDSVRRLGVTSPICVTDSPGHPDQWDLVYGHRRLAAAQQAGLSFVPAIVRLGLSREERVELRAIENLHRKDLSVLEEAAEYQTLVDLDWPQRKIAERFGRTQPHVSRRLKLLELPDQAKRAVDTGSITVETAAELTKLDEKTITRLVKNDNLTDRAVTVEIDTAKRQRKYGALVKPYLARGLKELKTVPYGVYTVAAEEKATAFSTNWDDTQVIFYKETPKPKQAKGSTNGAAASPVKETKRQREKREAEQQARAERLGAIAELVNATNPWLAAQALGLVVIDRWDDDYPEDHLNDVLGVLGFEQVPTDADGDLDPKIADVERNRLAELVATSPTAAIRVAMAVFFLHNMAFPTYRAARYQIRVHGLRLLAEAGATLTADEQKLVDELVGADNRPSSGNDHTDDADA